MAKGKIDNVVGNIKLVRGRNSKEETIDVAKRQNVDMDDNTQLHIRSGTAKINFLASRGTVAKADIRAKTGRGVYKFPCKLLGGTALKFWSNGKGSGCDRLRVGRDYTARDLPMSLAAPRATSAQVQTIQEAIQDLIDRNIMKGNPTGKTFDEKYKPNNPVTRAEFASLLSAANAYWQIPVTDRTLPLKDIANHWAKNAILLAVRTGFMSGYRDGRFGPDDRI
ncbi:MAG: S-layer homology domain-containing protein, partial [Synechococcales bacterium]|nr:S-layer homology domain-containing protein [Synechococcales bacterium]